MNSITNIIPVALLLIGVLVMLGAETANLVFFLGGFMAFIGVVYFITVFFFGNAKKADDWLSEH